MTEWTENVWSNKQFTLSLRCGTIDTKRKRNRKESFVFLLRNCRANPHQHQLLVSLFLRTDSGASLSRRQLIRQAKAPSTSVFFLFCTTCLGEASGAVPDSIAQPLQSSYIKTRPHRRNIKQIARPATKNATCVLALQCIASCV